MAKFVFMLMVLSGALVAAQTQTPELPVVRLEPGEPAAAITERPQVPCAAKGPDLANALSVQELLQEKLGGCRAPLEERAQTEPTVLSR